MTVRNEHLETLMRLPGESREQFETRAFGNANGFIAMYRQRPEFFKRPGWKITQFLVETKRITPSRYDLIAEITEEAE